MEKPKRNLKYKCPLNRGEFDVDKRTYYVYGDYCLYRCPAFRLRMCLKWFEYVEEKNKDD